MNRNFFNTLGLCRRAGFMSWGHDTVFEAIKNNKAKLLIITSDASERLKNEFMKTSKYDGRDIEILFIGETMDDMANMVGVKAGVFSVNDDGFVKLLKKHTN